MVQQLKNVFILRRNQVEARTGYSRSSIYALMKKGSFPTPIKLGARAVGWLDHEITAFLESRVAESRADVMGGV